MQFIGEIVREADERFALGPKAHRLVISALRRIIEQEPGGLEGFCLRLEQAGFAEDLAQWRDASVPLRLPDSKWIDTVLGQNDISVMGREHGLANARVRAALGYLIPALIRFFSRESRWPTLIPSSLLESLETEGSPRIQPRKPHAQRGRMKGAVRKRGSISRWFWAIGSAVLLASGFHLGRTILFEKPALTSHPSEAARGTPPEVNAVASAETPPQPIPAAQNAPQSRLVIRNIGQTVEYFGYLDSPETQKLIQEKLSVLFGVGRLSGELIVDPDRGKAPWQSQLDRVLPQLNVPGLDLRLDGNTVRVGGFLSEEDRAGILNSLMSTMGADYRFGYLRDERVERALDSNQWLSIKLKSITPDTKIQDVLQLLNRWVVDFDEGAALFPDHSLETARLVGTTLKGLRQAALIEVVIYTPPGPSALKLAADRALAVRDALVRGGYPATLLKTRGGVEGKSAKGQLEGAELNRMEFRLVQLCDPQFPCELSVSHSPRQEPQISEGVTRPDPVQAPRPSTPPAQGPIPAPSSATADRAVEEAKPRPPESDAQRPEEADFAVTPLKALQAPPDPAPKLRPKPKSSPTPLPKRESRPSKETEWYDPFGLF